MATVMKFGGTSVADPERIRQAARLVAERAARGEPVAVVVSAQGDFTDTLVKKAAALSSSPSAREMDVLLSAGEQISMALMAMALEQTGLPALSLTGWQAGIHTDGNHQSAAVQAVDAARVRAGLNAGKIVVVAGFQGLDARGDITTLGRGGSDTTAVALAAALGADRCLIYTDVSGVYSADPRVLPRAVRHDEIAYDQMLTLAALGAQVLHDRSVRMARDLAVPVTVLSSLDGGPGTRLVASTPDTGPVTAVTSDLLPPSGAGIGLARVSAVGPRADKSVGRVLAALARAGIPVLAKETGPLMACATVPEGRRADALRAVHDLFFTVEAQTSAAGR